MRLFGLAMLVVLLCSMEDRGRAQSADERGTIFFAPNTARSVTLSKAGIVLASFHVPKGTLLSVSYDKARDTVPMPDGSFEFHGDIEVRAQAASQRDQGVNLQQSMTQSPLLLTGQAVDVLVTP